MINKYVLIFLKFSALLDLGYTQYPIANYSKVFQDLDRTNREIPTEIYYPITSNGAWSDSVSTKFPVIIFGHGFLISWDAYQNLWEEFVPRGYLMVFPKTEAGINVDHQEFGWDLQYLVNKIQDEGNDSNSPIYNLVANNTALMGHSMGGGSLFLAADSLSDSNIHLKTIVGLAPVESSSNGVSSIISASNITIPSLILVGSQDGVAPFNDHQLPMYNNLNSECKTFISVLGGGHCFFCNPNFFCDFGEATSSTDIYITRNEQQQITSFFVNLWLDYTLKNDCDQFFVFQDSLNNSNRIIFEQSCIQNSITNIIENNGILSSSINGSGYQWYLNGDILPNANSISIMPNVSGSYSVQVYFSEGCSTLSQEYTFNYLTSIDKNNIPENFLLFQNYPNPFNAKTFIKYKLNQNDFVQFTIYDLNGKLIRTIVNNFQESGDRIIQWDAKNDNNEPVPTGLYIFKMQAGSFNKTKKMIFLE